MADQSKYQVAMINTVSRLRDKFKYLEWAQRASVDMLILTEARFNKDDKIPNEIKLYSSGPDARVEVYDMTGSANPSCRFANPRHVCMKLDNGWLIDAWYVPPGDQRSEDMTHTEELARGLAARRKKTVQIGDFNANHTWAGGKLNDARGKVAARHAAEAGYVSLNNVQGPSFKRSLGTGTPDWALATKDVADRIEFTMEQAEMYSDHMVFRLAINLTGERTEVRAGRIKPALFLKEVKRLENRDPTKWLETREKATAVSRTNKRTSKGERSDQEKYLVKEIRKLTQRINEKDMREQDLRQTRKLLWTLLDKEARKRREQHEVQRARNKSRQARKPTTVTCVGREGETHTGANAAQLILAHHFPEGQRETLVLPTCTGPDFAITEEEVDEAIRTGKDRSAPGQDNISYGLLKQWHGTCKYYFENLYNCWYASGSFPRELRTSNIVLINKSETLDPRPEDVRPIGLLDTIGKTYERILDMRLMHHVETRGLLQESQYGYRNDKSTQDAIMKVTHERLENKIARRHEVVIQLDMAKAFSRLKHSAIMEALQRLQVTPNIVRAVGEYLTDRRTKLTIGNETVEVPMYAGVVQGSVLGPHLFILTINQVLDVIEKLAKDMKKVRVVTCAFADDLLLIVSSKKGIKTAIKRANKIVSAAQEALKRLGLELSIEKTRVMVTQEEKDWKTARIMGQQIEISDSIEFLGVRMNRRGTAKDQMSKVKSVTGKAMDTLRNMRGLGHERRLEVARTIVYPKLTYGAGSWYSKNDRVQNEELQKIYYETAKLVAGMPENGGLNAATALSKLMPLQHQTRIDSEAWKARYSGKFEGITVEKRVPVKNSLHPAQRRGHQPEGRILTDEDTQQLTGWVKFYTDGSRRTEEKTVLVGAAVIREEDNNRETVQIKLPSHTTVFQAEAHGVKVALEWAMERKDSRVAILTDSMAVLTALSNKKPKLPSIHECQQLIRNMENHGATIQLWHVKAHSGIQLNEAVDGLAKQAAKEGDPETMDITTKTLRNLLVNRAWEDTTREYESRGVNSTIKKYIPTLDHSIRKKIQVNRDTVWIYNEYTRLFGEKRQLAKCDCGRDLSPEHLLHDCHYQQPANLEAAKQVNLPTKALHGSWQGLVAHNRFHDFIAARAPQVNKEIRRMLMAQGLLSSTQDK